MKEKLPPKVLPFSFHFASYAGISENERKDRKKKFRRQARNPRHVVFNFNFIVSCAYVCKK